MTPPNWKALAPFRSLAPGDPLHVERPEGDGLRIAEMLLAGVGPLLIVGPAGVGKSTELARAASALRKSRLPVMLLLDEHFALDRLDKDFTFRLVVHSVLEALPKAAQDQLRDVRGDALRENDRIIGSRGVQSSSRLIQSRDLARATLRTLAEVQGGRAALLVDGLERAPQRPRELALDALSSLMDDLDLALVAPWSLGRGPESYGLFRDRAQVVAVSPVPVSGLFGTLAEKNAGVREIGAMGASGDAFFEAMLRRRIALSSPPEGFWSLVRQAASASGGVPRTFLQILQQAGGFALVRSGRDYPVQVDLDRAVAGQVDSLRRLLDAGDLEELLAVSGSDGLTIPTHKKLRWLSHGLLLEYRLRDGDAIVAPHPLLTRPRGFA